MVSARPNRFHARGRPSSLPIFPQRIRPGLDRVRRALDLLGHPEESFASVLVGGTNGKGSVSAMVESGLRTAGYRTGLYTSPHLVNVRERAQVVGTPVSPAVWRRATVCVADLTRRHRLALTEFEAQTLAAFLVFAREGVEIAVLEVGLGGRLDAVNAVAAPELSVITSIGLDHTEWLGPTLRHIYLEKRGIARTGTALLQNLPASLRAEARRFAAEEGVPSWALGEEIQWGSVRGKRGGLGSRVRVSLPDATYDGVSVPFWGAHQAQNGALAVAALHVLRRRGWRISRAAMRDGVARSRWPGRFDVLQRTPPVVLDGAHNPAAARALAAAWKASPWGGERATLIFSCLRDKDVEGIAAALSGVARRVIVTPLVSDRARPVIDLAALWRRRLPTEIAPHFRAAWKEASKDKTSPVLVAGSLYLVGEAMKYFRRR
ncbi:MAG: bifunctional folylpolyglutamate synthase/dihydrofolate synthase [Elusimicrobia bacterium]|nr:bifunctional folylpolyglutamate synthase/dihydrofolate synthase [Elusimicrobiota bacterium]